MKYNKEVLVLSKYIPTKLALSVFDIDYNDLYITKINVDFSDAYNIIYGTNDRFLLNMKLSLGGNDFNKIYEHYKDILEA